MSNDGAADSQEQKEIKSDAPRPGPGPDLEMSSYSPPAIDGDGVQSSQPPTSTTIVDEAQECLAQSLLMFLYADLRLLSATGRINTKFETLCIDSDRVPRTTAAEFAQLEGCELPRDIASMNDLCKGVSPGQIMAILIMELRQEVLAQRRRAKEQIRRRDGAGWVTNPLAEEDDEEESDDDDDAGVMNKITDRRRRKEFETDMHTLIRSYNNMLAQDLKGIPEVKVDRMITNPFRRAAGERRPMHQRPWMRPGGLTQRLFSTESSDDLDQAPIQTGQESDEEGLRRGQGGIAARFTGALMRKSTRDPTDLTVESTESTDPSEGFANDNIEIPRVSLSQTSSGLKGNQLNRRPLSQIVEVDRETERGSELFSEGAEDLGGERATGNTTKTGAGKAKGEHDAQSPSGAGGGGRMNQSKLFEIIESLRGARAAQDAPDGEDLHSLKSDPGPNQSWRVAGDGPEVSGVSSRPPIHRRASTLKRELTQHLRNHVERYREDHVLHNKLIIPADDYETFHLAEDVGNNLVNLATSLTFSMSGVANELAENGDPQRNMSERELLDFMTKCLESRNGDSLDFMADFFRDDTISQTMVKSKAQVVWLQDWFPIKDCIYAISVDEKKKRVLVVFRGATTRADWNHGFDAAMKKAHNPVKDTYKRKKNILKIHRGFYTYLFRTRKDTSTRKYDEIANKVYEYGNKMIGSDFTVTVNGYSLGGALSILFGFYASTDDRFTRNGPVKIFSYGSPYVAGNEFADAFRYQEKKKKVQHARFYNSNDIVAHLPFNVKPTKRGSHFVHVGIDVKMYSVPGTTSLCGFRKPRFRHNDRLAPMAAYWRALTMNSLLNMPLPWLIKDKHGLPELQKRVARATLENSLAPTLDQLYEDLVYKNQD